MKNRLTITKLFAALVFVFLSGFKTQQEVIPTQLDWDTHFKAKPDEHSPYVALTATTWQYSYSSTVGRNKLLNIDFKFAAGVEPEKSWVKQNRIIDKKANRQLLNHEQGHVYINFLLLKEGEIVIRNQNYTLTNYKKLIQTTANKVSKYYSDMQSRYDEETKHGADPQAQSQWDDFLRDQMNKLK
ncbi:hypothetical protein [Pedobacter sp. Hv1]|uniref:DUF922 domain-containing protein n=1 Tax=Pedobacter sp. Hv1 TaxID=1740090 RepID=UPI0006D895D0|nr:hypothetical protein [Pedobacter sp. Hv1]KQB98952.1 hypothetical protein AQF98_19680 [Pedobacter sp. Hv1]